MYRTATRSIEVTVNPRFMSDRSSPENGYFFWPTPSRSSTGRQDGAAQDPPLDDHDAHGKLQEVRGAGVVGEEPVLKPGETYEYTSGVPLPTPSGFMVGSYGMVAEDGEGFDIAIPAFSLDSQTTTRTLN